MKNKSCTPPPPPPPNAPLDWNDAVRGNCFSNIERLGQWTGGTATLDDHTDPSKHFEKVAPGSLGGGPNPVPIYVITHGWAPGYRQVVDQNSGCLLWWSKEAHDATGVWTSNWAWVNTVAKTFFFGDVTVSATGLLQQIVSFEPNAIVLAYSWIDDSATDGDLIKLVDVYRSEAYTQVNGIRLANALEHAISSSFWTEGGSVRLLGHSHGSKVMTVAALTLQSRGKPVAHLSTLDSPETETPLLANAANMLGFYLEQLQICDPTDGSALGCGGVFTDNTASYFGVSYAGAGKLVNVALNPCELYDCPPLTSDGVTDAHKYAAAWYSGAQVGAEANDLPTLGLAWPPVSRPHSPALNQNWRSDNVVSEQWVLDRGPSIRDAYTYSTKPLSVRTETVRGNVVGDPSKRLIFGGSIETPTTYSFFEGTYRHAKDDDFYGIAFDLVWIMPRPGDYFVVAMQDFAGSPEVLLVMDGQSFPGGKTSVAINCDVAAGFTYAIYMYFWAKVDTTALPLDLVFVSNFRTVFVESQSGLLEASRKTTNQERMNQVVTHSRRRGTTPQTPPA